MSNPIDAHQSPFSPKTKDPLSIAFVGCGAVGRCLGRLLRDAGATVEAICCRTRKSALEASRFIGAGSPFGEEGIALAAGSAPVVIIATPDKAIPRAEAGIAPGMRAGGVVLHLSGALSSAVLERCRAGGFAIGSMHPLQSFADPETALEQVSGSIFACEGDEKALGVAFHIARLTGGKPIRIEGTAKTLYHAAAAAASNFMIPPLVLALDLMEAAGLSRELALEALKPLILGTAENVTRLGVPEALTGPIERGDQNVVENHLKALEKNRPDLKSLYLTFAGMTLDAAVRKGALSGEEAELMADLLRGYGPKDDEGQDL